MEGAETPELREARLAGEPYLRYPDGKGRERVLSLRGDWDRVTIGRAMSTDVALTWDGGASRVHAELVRLADDWAIIDDGLSSNGTFVNGELVERRRRLFDGVSYSAPYQESERTRVLARSS